MKNSTFSHDRHNSPLWPRYHPMWFKTLTLNDNCLFELLLWEKRKKKTNISQFSATHTYIKHLLAFPPFFVHLSLTCYFAVSPPLCQSRKSFISTSFVAEFSFSLAHTIFLVAFSLAETTFLVAETKFVKM